MFLDMDEQVYKHNAVPDAAGESLRAITDEISKLFKTSVCIGLTAWKYSHRDLADPFFFQIWLHKTSIHYKFKSFREVLDWIEYKKMLLQKITI
jgi:hypothetical protein